MPQHDEILTYHVLGFEWYGLHLQPVCRSGVVHSNPGMVYQTSSALRPVRQVEQVRPLFLKWDDRQPRQTISAHADVTITRSSTTYCSLPVRPLPHPFTTCQTGLWFSTHVYPQTHETANLMYFSAFLPSLPLMMVYQASFQGIVTIRPRVSAPILRHS